MLKSIHLASIPIVKSLQAPYAVRPAAGTVVLDRAYHLALRPHTHYRSGQDGAGDRGTQAPQGPELGPGTSTTPRTLLLAGQIASHLLALTLGDESHSELLRAGQTVIALNAKLNGDQRCCKQWPRAGGAAGPPKSITNQTGSRWCTLAANCLLQMGEVNMLCTSR